MNEEDKIAVFKYGLIAPVINDQSINKTSYFKKIAKIEYEYPGRIDKVKFSYRTFKKWLHTYRKYGYEGLKPSSRTDKGKSRKIQPATQEQIRELVTAHDFKTISNLYRYLVTEKFIEPEMFTEVTLRNFLKANGIQFESEGKKPRKAFEAPHINILWTTDFMHGPYVREGKRKVKSYLCAIIDDYSRLITGALFYTSEGSLSLEKTLKNAVLTYGIPQKLYCDNGKVFVSGYIHMVCAKLGTALIHSKPYDSPSRGKIERFFRTVRDMFLPNIYFNADLTIESLNDQFTGWLNGEYNLNLHRGTGDTPLDRYLNDIPNVKIRGLLPQEADNCFYHTLYRRVKNDATITVDNRLYEVPAKYIGKKIEIRFPLDDPLDIRIFENNSQAAVPKKLDKHFNSEMHIRYSRKEGGDV